MEYNLTLDSLKKANDDNYYWQVYVRPGSKVLKKFKLTSAVQRWTKDESKNDLYSPSLRIVGNQEEITRWMSSRNYAPEQIESILDEAFGSDNTDDPEFKELTARKKAITKSQALDALKQFNVSISGKSSTNLEVKLCNAMNEEKTSPKMRMMKKNVSTSNDTTTTTPSTYQLKKKIEARINRLKDGQVLDVSSLDGNDGKGMKVIQRPLSNDRVRHGISDLPIISSSEEMFEHVLVVLELHDRKGEWAATRAINNARTPPRQQQ